MRKPKAIIVGGSIAGISCAKALILAGWDVVVIEKTRGPPTGNPTGAGIALNPLSQKMVKSWLHQPDLLHNITLPLTIDQSYIQYSASGNFFWGHLYLTFCISHDKSTVNVKAKNLKTDEVIDIAGDLLVAADESRSSVRQTFLPDSKLRYTGYCAWMGVFDFSENENSETIQGIRKAYPELGNGVHVDLGPGTHTVLYELMYKRLNWIWFISQPEPQLKGDSATMKVSSDMIKKMHQEAEKIWVPEFARVIKETKEPFLNLMYDCDPLTQIYWDNVVLIGDAAHPITPHCARSTNMAIADAAVLGKCLERWGPENLHSALEEHQSVRLPVTTKQVLHSRRVGQIKLGLPTPDREPFDPNTASPEDCEILKQRRLPFFDDVPSILE
ncbi:FAD binding 3 domain-containing protein [Citrus sinensis]|uniref:FAD binding 3 domain-containing protein n=1 Tax=Citrus sinensis TaxID=2711 RepID=A0ACB8NMB5_CITSI|nr:FAD binding 3 domain-containing protein [Citrus sinensis]